MPVGNEIKFPDGVVRLGPESLIWHMKAKGSLSISTSAAPPAYKETTLVINHACAFSDAPMLVISPINATAAYKLKSISPTQVTYVIYTRYNESCTLQWFFFTMQDPPPNASKTGVEMYAPDGRLYLASETPFLKSVAQIGRDGSYTGVAARKYGFILPNLVVDSQTDYMWLDDLEGYWTLYATQVGYIRGAMTSSSQQAISASNVGYIENGWTAGGQWEFPEPPHEWTEGPFYSGIERFIIVDITDL